MLIDELYKQIWQLKVENEFLKKNLILPLDQRKKCIEPNPIFCIRQQSKILQVNRSSLYYKPVGESEFNIKLMHLLDEQYTKTPFYGVPRMTYR